MRIKEKKIEKENGPNSLKYSSFAAEGNVSNETDLIYRP